MRSGDLENIRINLLLIKTVFKENVLFKTFSLERKKVFFMLKLKR